MRYATVVGARNTPKNILEIMIRLGRTMVDLGYRLRSGDAYGADRAFWYGAQQSKRYEEGRFKAYIIFDGFLKRKTNDKTFINFSTLPENIKLRAAKLSITARGSEFGLNPITRLLFARNAIQVLGEELDLPSDTIIFYAKQNNTNKNKVAGGTNTTLQIALLEKVPKVINLYDPKQLKNIKEWLKKHEKTYPYNEIIWKEILHPKNHK